MKQKYVIWLTSEQEWSTSTNAYGYWSGKSYTKYGEIFPITDNDIIDRTKIYTSHKRAENALDAALNKFTYVLDGRVEPYYKESE